MLELVCGGCNSFSARFKYHGGSIRSHVASEERSKFKIQVLIHQNLTLLSCQFAGAFKRYTLYLNNVLRGSVEHDMADFHWSSDILRNRVMFHNHVLIRSRLQIAPLES